MSKTSKKLKKRLAKDKEDLKRLGDLEWIITDWAFGSRDPLPTLKKLFNIVYPGSHEETDEV
jgi:hypothetical protein